MWYIFLQDPVFKIRTSTKTLPLQLTQAIITKRKLERFRSIKIKSKNIFSDKKKLVYLYVNVMESVKKEFLGFSAIRSFFLRLILVS